MATNNAANDDRDESLEMQNDFDRQAGLGDGLGDRSASGLNNAGRTGIGGGTNADDLRMAASGATDPSLDENEASYGGNDPEGQGRATSGTKDLSDSPAPEDGADRDLEEGSSDSKGKADFISLESEDDR